jgi:hypothetical protein
MDKDYEIVIMNYHPKTSPKFKDGAQCGLITLGQLMNSVILDLDSAISLFMGMDEEDEIVFAFIGGDENKKSISIILNEDVKIEELYCEEEEEDASI